MSDFKKDWEKKAEKEGGGQPGGVRARKEVDQVPRITLALINQRS